ncbi:hypothetical protein HMN09_01022300 [Mycena chlorophos]|uniref:DUF6533 domain-containing protein n=1 Tax=Mycena chlorophos TaxID=658473 RepID=A0A8H6SFL3_MYCCL|nr:hypothetical protein HMN09_01022300 [Mycena chlorophos]
MEGPDSSLGDPLRNAAKLSFIPYLSLLLCFVSWAYLDVVAALTWLFYDILITYDQELEFVWPKPWTRMKFLFFFIRYLPLAVQISILTIGSPELTPSFHFTQHDCFIWQVYQGVATLFLFAAVDYVLILRVYALYHNNRLVRTTVLAAFGTEVVLMASGLGLSLRSIQFDDLCVVLHISDILLLYGGATLLFQTFLFCLTAAKFVRALRDGWGDTPLVTLVMRDGTWAFIFLFAVVAGDASLYGLKNHSFAGILYGWLLSVFSFCGYRILLNLDRLSAAERRPTRQRASTSTAYRSSYQFTTHLVDENDAHQPTRVSVDVP